MRPSSLAHKQWQALPGLLRPDPVLPGCCRHDDGRDRAQTPARIRAIRLRGNRALGAGLGPTQIGDELGTGRVARLLTRQA